MGRGEPGLPVHTYMYIQYNNEPCWWLLENNMQSTLHNVGMNVHYACMHVCTRICLSAARAELKQTHR